MHLRSYFFSALTCAANLVLPGKEHEARDDQDDQDELDELDEQDEQDELDELDGQGVAMDSYTYGFAPFSCGCA